MDAFELYCKRFNEYLNSLPIEKIRMESEKGLKQNEEEFQDFREKFARGFCSYCGLSLLSFVKSKPCPHWLLKPKGFRKRFFPILYSIKSFHELEAYLRWVANSEILVRNMAHDKLSEI